MENKNKKYIVLVAILMILVLGLGGFIVYDKVLKDDKTTNNENSNSENSNNENLILKAAQLGNKAMEVGNKKVDGDGWTGHEIPDISRKDKKIFSGRINPNGSVKLDGHYCTIYDGKPKYYNTLD